MNFHLKNLLFLYNFYNQKYIKFLEDDKNIHYYYLNFQNNYFVSIN